MPTKDNCSWCTNFTGLGLIIPGVGLYVYIIYIIASKLLYPATFLPFVQSHGAEEEPLDDQGKCQIHYNTERNSTVDY